MTLTAAQLIEKLKKCPPETLIAVDRGDVGTSATPLVYLVNRHVSEHQSMLGPYVGEHGDDGPHEDIVIISHWAPTGGVEL